MLFLGDSEFACVRKGKCGLYSYAVHNHTVTFDTLVLQWTLCADLLLGRLVETLGSRVTPIDSLAVDRAAICLNNTLKGCIVNFATEE